MGCGTGQACPASMARIKFLARYTSYIVKCLFLLLEAITCRSGINTKIDQSLCCHYNNMNLHIPPKTCILESLEMPMIIGLDHRYFKIIC